MEVFGNIIGLGIMSLTHIFSWHCLEQQKVNYRDYKLYVVICIYIGLMATNLTFINNFFRVVVTTVISMFINYYLMRKSIKKTILMPLMTQILIMLAETVLALFLSSMGVDLKTIADGKFGGFALDAVISIIVILIYFFCPFLPKLYQMIVRETDKINYEYFILSGIIIILIANILGATTYYKVDFKYLLLFNTIITVVYCIIVIHSFLNRNSYLKLSDKYNTTLSNLREYEDILNQYRVSSHENKNQLMTIRNMVRNKDKNISEYIDKIVENELSDNEVLMVQSMVIPEGGLRGLLYGKMLLIKEKKIDYDLSVDKAIRSIQLITLGEQTMLDICNIIGVFLDNAIDAVENLEKKYIDFEMSKEDNHLRISVTNNFVGTIDLDRMEKIGFTSKGEQHGYGLYLVKMLVEKNQQLQHKKKVLNNDFMQTLIINLDR